MIAEAGPAIHDGRRSLEHRVPPGDVSGMQVTGVDQLWVADITYLRLQRQGAERASHPDALAGGAEIEPHAPGQPRGARPDA